MRELRGCHLLSRQPKIQGQSGGGDKLIQRVGRSISADTVQRLAEALISIPALRLKSLWELIVLDSD